ncbi:unnamed protein product [Microthlaspi erraticum]|uniref:Uncharacterized protein n=1 Tax=Microthlaspi erraticum TaxID=1685480 RepID=A0A6D2KIM7_9BRAS|nr:unnamed protein product [Microthlaspi erraticum]
MRQTIFLNITHHRLELLQFETNLRHLRRPNLTRIVEGVYKEAASSGNNGERSSICEGDREGSNRCWVLPRTLMREPLLMLMRSIGVHSGLVIKERNRSRNSSLQGHLLNSALATVIVEQMLLVLLYQKKHRLRLQSSIITSPSTG